ncbi:CHRD domain-containing protein [Aquiflexum sp.]|uniref:CHRD domain-containing protein n=1 Tax=Aquiflexum sp. TaxID=1872584 RepID=UPI003594486F
MTKIAIFFGYALGNLRAKDLVGKMLGGDLLILGEAFRTGNAYVNVLTDKFPEGELRGQL